jgi:hypothetical protein
MASSYQFGLDEPWPRGWPNDWLLMSVVGGPGSWYRLYNEPNLKKFHQPTVHGVDYPTVDVGQAYYDEGLGALMVAIFPGNTTFKVTNLTGTERKVSQDGVPFGGLKAVGDGEIEVTTTVDRHAFVIR